MKALKELRSEPVETPEPEQPVARNAQCPCGSGGKYKRCCGRQAPPLPGNSGHRIRHTIAPTSS